MLKDSWGNGCFNVTAKEFAYQTLFKDVKVHKPKVEYALVLKGPFKRRSFLEALNIFWRIACKRFLKKVNK